MLEFYRIEYSITDSNTNRKLVNWYAWHDICTDQEMTSKSIALNWDNISNVEIHEFLNPDIKIKKKGLVFQFHESLGDFYFQYKQGKRPALNLEYKITYTPVIKSISDVIKYSDSTLAIRYLMERGLNAKFIIDSKNGIGAIINGIR